jgi:hypothetical protein
MASLRLYYVTDPAIIWPHMAMVTHAALVHYHKCTRLMVHDRTSITSVRSHGHVARDHTMPAQYCKLMYL